MNWKLFFLLFSIFLIIVAITITIIVVINNSNQNKAESSSTKTPVKTTQPTKTTIPNTTMPNTTIPNTTIPNTTMPNTTTPGNTTQPPPTNLVKIISIERYSNTPPINIARIIPYDDNDNIITDGNVVGQTVTSVSSTVSPSKIQRVKAILSPYFDTNYSYPATNILYSNTTPNTFAHTGDNKNMPHPDNYLMYGDYINDPIYTSKGCPVGYYDKTNGNAIEMVDCGLNCPSNQSTTLGPKYGPVVKTQSGDYSANSSCECACVPLPSETPSEYTPDHIAYVPSIDKYVFMKVIGSYLKMVTSDNTEAKKTEAPSGLVAEEIFDPTRWSSYNSIVAGQAGIAVKQKNNFDPAKQYYQYIKIILSIPQTINGIMIFNRLDCCKDRIDGLFCKTINQYRTELSKTKITGSSDNYSLAYDIYTGKNIYISPPAESAFNIYKTITPSTNFSNFWISSDGQLTQCVFFIKAGQKYLFGCNMSNQIYLKAIGVSSWNQIQNLSGNQITASKNYMLIKNQTNDVSYSPIDGSSNSSNWKSVTPPTDRKIIQAKIDTVNDKIYIISNNGYPYYARDITNPDWQAIPIYQRGIYITSCNDKICYIDIYKNLQYYTNNNWIKVGGLSTGVVQVEIDMFTVYVVDINNNVYCTELYNPNFPVNPTWKQLPSLLTYISSYNGRLCGISSANNIYLYY